MKCDEKRRLELLAMPCWTYQEIMEWTGIKSPTTALRIKERALRECDGFVQLNSKFVKTDSVLKLYGTDRKTECELVKALNVIGEKFSKINIYK